MAYLDKKKGKDLFFLVDLSPLQIKILAAGNSKIYESMQVRNIESDEDRENLRAAEELNRILTINPSTDE